MALSCASSTACSGSTTGRSFHLATDLSSYVLLLALAGPEEAVRGEQEGLGSFKLLCFPTTLVLLWVFFLRARLSDLDRQEAISSSLVLMSCFAVAYRAGVLYRRTVSCL